MATTIRSQTAILLIILLLLVSLAIALAHTSNHSRRSTAKIINFGKSSMLLPLYHSTMRRQLGAVFGRKLQITARRKDNARMRLYDNLLTDVYYTTRLWIGTPPQEFALIVDTGSTVTYVPCSNCDECGRHQDPKFQPDQSSTYEPVKCNLNCNCDVGGTVCTYERNYAEMSSSNGILSQDLISFGNDSQLVPQRLVFGCETVETGDLYSQRADGIVGMGRGQLSIVDQLVEKGSIDDSFSLCYGGMGTIGGAMILGKIPPPPDMAFAHSDPYRSPYYNIDLKEIHVAGKPLHVTPKTFDGKYGTVLDSGTTYAYLPKAAFLAFTNAIRREIPNLKQINGPDPNFSDICFSDAGSNISQLSKTFPVVTMVFGNEQKILLSPENYLFQHTKVHGAYCLGIFQNGDPSTLLGGIVVRNTLVTYDRENEKIGFWKTNCSDLWRTLNLSTAPELAPLTAPAASPMVAVPAPMVSSDSDKNVNLPPIQATSRSPQTQLPGEFQIGVITFDLLFSTNNSHMQPNFTELLEAIAHELDVNIPQVHLLNFNSNDSNLAAQCAIYPADRASYFSSTTATTIILRLTAHPLHLPDSFRNYQVVGWKIQPSTKRNWLERHMLAVIIGVISVIILSVSLVAIWFIRRSKIQQINSYKPVNDDVKVPEQELQSFQTQP